MPPKSSLTRRTSAQSWKPPKSSLTATGLRAVGGQVAIENVLNNAVLYFPSFYAVQSLYQGGRAIDGLAKFQERWREDVPAIWSFWVPVQTANFLFSPLWARVPVTAAASLLWTSYVSFSRGCPGPCPQNAPTRCDGVPTQCDGGVRG